MSAGDREKGNTGRLLLALARGLSFADAASESGVSERTVRRRWHKGPLRRRVSQLRDAMLTQAVGHITDGMTEAAETLRRLLDAASEGVRLAAAKALLGMGLKLREATELADRVTELENQGTRNRKTDGEPRTTPTSA